VKHTQLILFLLPQVPHQTVLSGIRVRMKFAVWRQQDAMRQRAIRSEVIPLSFRDQKKTILPHCSRQ
jgi:hypothetical protein